MSCDKSESRIEILYLIFNWVRPFHLGMAFSVGYGLPIWIWPFHLDMVLSFGYSLFIELPHLMLSGIDQPLSKRGRGIYGEL